MTDEEEKKVQKIEDMVEEVLADLYKKADVFLKAKLIHVEFTVAFRQTEEQAIYAGVKSDKQLAGLFYGVPLSAPAVIYLFAGAIMDFIRTDEEYKKEVERIILHEIGHYLGYKHKDLAKLNLNSPVDFKKL